VAYFDAAKFWHWLASLFSLGEGVAVLCQKRVKGQMPNGMSKRDGLEVTA
jgi:hypothetical protein